METKPEMMKLIRRIALFLIAIVAICLLVIPCLFFLLDRPNNSALEAALNSLREKGIDRQSFENLAVVDFTKPSFFRRLAIYDADGDVAQYLVAHGRNSGDVYATRFSNERKSYQTCLGLFRVGEQYDGKHGLSIRLDGLEPGINDLARERAIVIHAASYVSIPSAIENLFIGEGPRMGKSKGCPAISEKNFPEVVSKLSEGCYLYHYFPEEE